MISRQLQPVVPKEIHATYTEKQQKSLYSVEDFLGLVKERQMFADRYPDD